MKKQIFLSRSPKQTQGIAKRFAQCLGPGSVISLEGNLGSGKTTFVKGLARGLGGVHAREVKSPTFVLLHIYPTQIPLYHFDLYRLDKVRELEAVGFEEFTSDPGAIACIEWGEKARGLLPRRIYRVRLGITGEKTRSISIFQTGQAAGKKRGLQKPGFFRKIEL